ncbi:MAG: L,D-transpeptidase family protein [Actinomycetota bacterium]
MKRDGLDNPSSPEPIAEVIVEETGDVVAPAPRPEGDASVIDVETAVGVVQFGAVPTVYVGEIEAETMVLAEEVEPELVESAPERPAGVSASADVVPASRSFRMPRLARRFALVLGLVFLLAFSGVAYATYDYDQTYDGKILPGVEIAGVDVGGMTRRQALRAVKGASAIQLDRVVTVEWKDREWTVTPRKLGARSNAATLVDRALQTSQSTNVFTKATMAVLGEQLDHVHELAITYPRQGIRGFVEGVASSLDREPVEASIDYSSGWVEMEPARDGRKVQAKLSRRALLSALKGDEDTVDLAVKTMPAPDTGDKYDQILLLRMGENRLYLYQDGEITHEYTVASGLPEYPTPTGEYVITEKRYLPTWVNPDPTGWGASMPAMIGPGPGNPLGTRALNWSASGIRFHGTEATYSLGYAASHGCVRLSMPDIEELYDLVDVGTPIVSIYASSPDPLYAAAPDPTVVEEDAGDEAPSTDATEG